MIPLDVYTGGSVAVSLGHYIYNESSERDRAQTGLNSRPKKRSCERKDQQTRPHERASRARGSTPDKVRAWPAKRLYQSAFYSFWVSRSALKLKRGDARRAGRSPATGGDLLEMKKLVSTVRTMGQWWSANLPRTRSKAEVARRFGQNRIRTRLRRSLGCTNSTSNIACGMGSPVIVTVLLDAGHQSRQEES